MFRRALQEISSSPYLSRGNDAGNLSWIQDSYLTPSPEEQIIQQRSRRILAEAIVCQLESFQHAEMVRSIDLVRTPSKEGGLSHLSRKRLLLTPPDSSSKPSKRIRLAKKGKSTHLKTELHGYSTQQLVDVIDNLVSNHPELEKEVRGSISQPDIKGLEESLQQLRRNVYRALPTNRWETSRDAYSFKRVKIHLEAFKHSCVEQGRRLVLAHCWEAVVNYALMASKLVHQLPDWDNPSHNALKLVCLRTLAAQFMVGLKRGQFAESVLVEIQDRLEMVVMMNQELQPCLSQIQKLLTVNISE